MVKKKYNPQVGDYCYFHPNRFKKTHPFPSDRANRPRKKIIVLVADKIWPFSYRIKLPSYELTCSEHCLSQISKKRMCLIKKTQIKIKILQLQIQQPFFSETESKYWKNMSSTLTTAQRDLDALFI